MKTILTPIDFSDATEKVTDSALSLAKAFQGRIVLLHIVFPSVVAKAYRLPPEEIDEQVVEEMRKGEERLQQWKKKLEEQGATVEVRCREGNTARSILDAAKELEAGLIVMGSHGHGAVYEILVGTTTHEVVHGASCPVVIVPVRPDR